MIRYLPNGVINMEPHPEGSWVIWEDVQKRIADLKAERYALKQLADPLTKALYDEMAKRHTEVCKENAKLKNAAKEYSYNEHFPSCKINNPSIKRCNCGYAELAALLEGKP